jgi:hypothetical protein
MGGPFRRGGIILAEQVVSAIPLDEPGLVVDSALIRCVVELRTNRIGGIEFAGLQAVFSGLVGLAKHVEGKSIVAQSITPSANIC